MNLAVTQRRAKLADNVRKLIAVEWATAEIKAAGQEWLDNMDDAEGSRAAGAKLVAACNEGIEPGCECDACKAAREVLKDADLLTKKSIWIFGGDGWAYDIGYGGVDHALASGTDINIFCFNTEVYSNTGGQSSKATPEGAVAQFAAAGKDIKQKDLAAMAMSYGYVYVAQISMGADKNQTIKDIAEAEAYPGPSLIIAYAPCINHGIRKGMAKVQDEEKLAVDTGYWNLFRFNPAGGAKKFTLDSKPAKLDYMDFLAGEVRYTSLKQKNPERAARLFGEAKENAQKHYEYLSKLGALYNEE